MGQVGTSSHPTLVVECYGRYCTATHALLNKLGHLAADSGRVTQGAWIECALRRLSVAPCQGKDFVFRANLHSFCHATGKNLTRGAVVPHTLEVSPGRALCHAPPPPHPPAPPLLCVCAFDGFLL